MPKLANEKHERFCQEYLIDLNATQAAIRAGYSEKSARTTAARMLANDNIASRVQELFGEREKRTGVTADRVVEELERLAFSDLRDAVEWGSSGVTLKESTELSRDAAAFVASVSEGKDGVTIKTHNKIAALKLLGEHLGLFKGGNEEEIRLRPLPVIQIVHEPAEAPDEIRRQYATDESDK